MELEKMNDCGLIPYWDHDNGGIADKAVFDQFFASPEEDTAWNRYMERHVLLNTGLYGLLARGMYAVQLRPWFKAFPKDQFLVLRLESMKMKSSSDGGGGGVQAMMRTVWAHLDLPNHSVRDETPKNTRDYQPMDVEVKEYLERFFEPHNRKLAQVLLGHGDDDDEAAAEEWKNPWPYHQ